MKCKHYYNLQPICCVYNNQLSRHLTTGMVKYSNQITILVLISYNIYKMLIVVTNIVTK